MLCTKHNERLSRSLVVFYQERLFCYYYCIELYECLLIYLNEQSNLSQLARNLLRIECQILQTGWNVGKVIG